MPRSLADMSFFIYIPLLAGSVKSMIDAVVASRLLIPEVGLRRKTKPGFVRLYSQQRERGTGLGLWVSATPAPEQRSVQQVIAINTQGIRNAARRSLFDKDQRPHSFQLRSSDQRKFIMFLIRPGIVSA
jgi:hypothetical protein